MSPIFFSKPTLFLTDHYQSLPSALLASSWCLSRLMHCKQQHIYELEKDFMKSHFLVLIIKYLGTGTIMADWVRKLSASVAIRFLLPFSFRGGEFSRWRFLRNSQSIPKFWLDPEFLPHEYRGIKQTTTAQPTRTTGRTAYNRVRPGALRPSFATH